MLDHVQRMKPEHAQLLRRIALFITFLLSGGNNIFPRVPLAIALIGVCFLLQGMRMGIRRELGACFMLMIATFTVAIIGAGQFLTEAIIIRFTNFALGMLVLGLYLDLPRRQFVDDIYPMLKLMCWQAIFTVILGAVVPGLFTVVDVQETFYRTIGWVFTYHTTGTEASALVRANGFFFEPGVFQLYLNLFVFMAAFVRSNRGDIVLGLVAVLATQSTMGLVLAGGMAGYYYLKNLKSVPFPTKLLITALAPLVLVPLLFTVIANVNQKVSGDARGSAWARTYDLNTGLAVVQKYPWLGIGFDYSRYYRESLTVGYKETELDNDTIINRGNSNGVVTVLYSLGIPLGLVFFIGLYRQSILPHRWLLGIVMFSSLMTEALFFSPFILLFVYSGLLLRPQSVPLEQWRQFRLFRI
jgi:hypothetical protein